MNLPEFPKEAELKVGVRVPVAEADASTEYMKKMTHYAVDEMFRKIHISKTVTWKVEIVTLDEPGFKGYAIDATATAFLKDVI